VISARTAAVLSLFLAGLALAARLSRRRWVDRAGAYVREAALILGLYVVWQYALDLAVTSVRGAVPHAMGLWQAERAVHLPSELSLQRAVLPHPGLVRAANDYYSIAHFPALIVCLLWLFARHRSHYGWARAALVVSTAACLAIQTIPVAPPRLLDRLGFVDTAVLYRQSNYGPVGGADPGQVISMPSVHVAWAVLVAVVVVMVSRSPWRWLVVAHPIVTTVVVVVTANHFWLDGVVAAAMVALALAGQAWVRTVRPRDGDLPFALIAPG
jgi:hypothetical protein